MFKVSYFLEVLPIIASKVNVTFELTIAATIFALVVGVIIAIIGYYKIPGLYQLTRVYVSIMRGTPVVAQLYFFYYGIALYSAIVRNMTPLIAVAVVMSLNMGAFMSESIRGALLSVDEGQKEAAYSLGMTNFQLVTRIVIPQAVRVALPPLFNDIINLIKMTSLAFMLGVPDIMGAAKIEGARTFRYFEIYAAVMLVYWLIIFINKEKEEISIMKKRVLAALLVTMMTVGTVAGCGSSSKSDDSDKKTTSDAKSDDKKDSGKKVTVVTSGTGEPYSLLSDDGKWTGIDADMWDEIEKRTGWEVEVKQASFDAMWGELDTNRVDVVANCLAVKPERTDKYNATIPYYGDSQCIIVNDDSDYKTADDLKGKTVGCTNGQAAQTIIEDMAAEKGFTVKLYEDSAVGMNDLKLGRIDAYANTTTNVNAFTHNNSDAKFRFFDEQLLANNVAYFLPKTDDGEKLTKELNDVIQEMLDDGTVAKITEKWMYADMTKLIQK